MMQYYGYDMYLVDGPQENIKVYAAEKYDENHQVIPDSLTPKGYVKKIYVNPEWEYFKNKAILPEDELLFDLPHPTRSKAAKQIPTKAPAFRFNLLPPFVP